jgi:hypothetical protein
MRQGTQPASTDNSHVSTLDAVNFSTIPDRFLRFILERYLLTIISGMLFQNKRFVQIITRRSYLVIGSGYKG